MGTEDQTVSSVDRRTLVGALRAVRGRARVLLIAARVCMVLAVLVGVGVVLGLTDYVLRLPTWLRMLHLVAGAGALVLVFRRVVMPAWRFAPSITDVALRVEQNRPEFRGLLASAVDFAGSDAAHGAGGAPMRAALASQVVKRGLEAIRTVGLRGVLEPRAMSRRAWWLVGSLAAAAGLFAASPSLWAIGAVRLAAPWAWL